MKMKDFLGLIQQVSDASGVHPLRFFGESPRQEFMKDVTPVKQVNEPLILEDKSEESESR